jgi:hypothetical protein
VPFRACHALELLKYDPKKRIQNKPRSRTYYSNRNLKTSVYNFQGWEKFVPSGGGHNVLSQSLVDCLYVWAKLWHCTGPDAPSPLVGIPHMVAQPQEHAKSPLEMCTLTARMLFHPRVISTISWWYRQQHELKSRSRFTK